MKRLNDVPSLTRGFCLTLGTLLFLACGLLAGSSGDGGSEGGAKADGAAGIPYNATLRAIGGTGAQAWSVGLPGDGVLPVGLTLNNAGPLASVPTTSGPFNFTAQDSADPPQVTTKNIGLVITGGRIPSNLPRFPLVISDNRRYLQDQNGVPFPILGRTAWFITSLSAADYQAFVDDTVAKGYNAIEFHVINHDARGNKPPFAGNGALPFTKRVDGSDWDGLLLYRNIATEAPDFTQTNESYWAHIDALLAYAESKGVLCFMFPAYAGYQGGSQGWMAEMTANGATKMASYGAFIAARYKTRSNIVWMLGGDYGTGGNNFTATELVVERALLSGLKSITGQASVQFSAEWNGPSIYTDQTDATLLTAGTLQGAYSWEGDVNTYTRNGYAYTPVMPTFLLEEPYDEEGPDGNKVNPNATQPVRRFQWWGWLSGIGGYISGNGYVWPFTPGLWTTHLNTQGARDMGCLNTFVKSIAWYNLVPSGLGGMRPLITVGGSMPSRSDYVAAAAAPDGTLLVAYVPPDHSGSIIVDMTGMIGPTRARWFDPTTAAYSEIGLLPQGTMSKTFSSPSKSNGSGLSDWVLLLEKQ